MLVRRVLVVDGQTAMGPAMLEALARGGYDARLTTRPELGTHDHRACRSALRALEPDVVIDCSDVGGNPDEEHARHFVASTGNLATAARAGGALSVFLSDAEVFDGSRVVPYVESSAPAPATTRGAAILAAERAAARANPRHALVRTSWLFGPAAPGFIDELLAAAERGDEPTVDAAVESSPTYAPHLAGAMLPLLRQTGYGVFHCAAAGSCTRLELVGTLLSMVDPSTAAPVPDATPEPARRLVLNSVRAELPSLPHWHVGLADHLRARKTTGGAAAPPVNPLESAGG